jgi:hypothetical protein
MSINVIFDGQLNPNTISESNIFTNANFLLLDVISPVLADNEGVLIGLGLLARIPIIGKTAIKYVPHKITEYEVNARELGDSTELIAIPYEFSNSPYEFFLGLNSSQSVTLRIYAITNYENNIDINHDLIQEVLNKINEIKLRQDLNIALDTSQNVAIGILGTGLIPVTGGVTSPIPAIVGQPLGGLLPVS